MVGLKKAISQTKSLKQTNKALKLNRFAFLFTIFFVYHSAFSCLRTLVPQSWAVPWLDITLDEAPVSSAHTWGLTPWVTLVRETPGDLRVSTDSCPALPVPQFLRMLFAWADARRPSWGADFGPHTMQKGSINVSGRDCHFLATCVAWFGRSGATAGLGFSHYSDDSIQ